MTEAEHKVHDVMVVRSLAGFQAVCGPCAWASPPHADPDRARFNGVYHSTVSEEAPALIVVDGGDMTPLAAWIRGGSSAGDRVWSPGIAPDAVGALNELAAEIHGIAADHGFWPPQGRNIGEMLMLVVSECAEAMEEHRDGADPGQVRYVVKPDVRALFWGEYEGDPADVTEEQVELWARQRDLAKPDGFPVELADVIIRVLDIGYALGIDLDAVVAEKIRFNATRPHKHGKRC